MEKRKILLIDDELHSREICRLLLEKYESVEISEAENGQAGINLAKRLNPDLIILDNKMPVMSGEHTAKMLRSDVNTKKIPIIMITAMQLTKGDMNLIKLDVDDVLLKPFSPWELISKIELYIGSLVEEL
jgi:CheY-like chemotaxis protein